VMVAEDESDEQSLASKNDICQNDCEAPMNSPQNHLSSSPLDEDEIEDDDSLHSSDSDRHHSMGGKQLPPGIFADRGPPLTLFEIGKRLKEGTFKKVMVLSGAGVSVSAGIPDFRTPGTGLYDNLQKYNLPEPQAVFDIQYYRYNPNPFLSLAREIWPGRHCPTATHCFLKLLQNKGILLRNYTQNIDGLETIAGVDSSKVVECHGHFRSASCVECGTPFSGKECRIHMMDATKTLPPLCANCGGYVKPDIVFFGEGLPTHFRRLLQSDLAPMYHADINEDNSEGPPDLLIVMGTSLMVAPVSLIPRMVACPRVLFNRELVGNFMSASEGYTRKNKRRRSYDDEDGFFEDESDEDDSDDPPQMEAGGGWSNQGHYDVYEPGNCDDSVKKLCEVAGWEAELDEIMASVKSKVENIRADDGKSPIDCDNLAGVEPLSMEQECSVECSVSPDKISLETCDSRNRLPLKDSPTVKQEPSLKTDKTPSVTCATMPLLSPAIKTASPALDKVNG